MLHVVVGGQAGSESKGRVTGFLSEAPGSAVLRVGGPNAGHVVYDAAGNRFALRQIPVGAVHPETTHLIIGPGSEVDPVVLAREINELEAAGHEIESRLWVDPSATLLSKIHIDQEVESDLNERLGSTAKGIGAARAARIWRTAKTVGQAMIHQYIRRPDPRLLADLSVSRQRHLIVEGTQGYALGLHTDNYPFTTSGDCRAIDFLAQAGLSPWLAIQHGTFNVHVVTRPYPIRVAGNSGPMHAETSWTELGLIEERTTVTNRVRRVGHFDRAQVREAMLANGYDDRELGAVWLSPSMIDHLVPAIAGATHWNLANYDEVAINDALNAVVSMGRTLGFGRPVSTFTSVIGTGPETSLYFGDLLRAAGGSSVSTDGLPGHSTPPSAPNSRESQREATTTP